MTKCKLGINPKKARNAALRNVPGAAGKRRNTVGAKTC